MRGVSRLVGGFSVVLLSSWLAGACGGSDPEDTRERGGSGGAAGNAGTGAGTGAGTMAAGMGSNAGTAGSSATAGSAGNGASGSAGTGGESGATAGAGAGGAGTAGTTAGEGGMPSNDDGSYFPLTTGNSWTFRTTNAGVVSDKTQTVGDLEMVGGSGPNASTMAYYVLTQKDDGTDKTESWQAEIDGSVVRYRERAYSMSTGELELEEHWEPYKLRVDGTDERVMTGATWVEQYTETKLPVGMAPATDTSSDTWRVIAQSESVTVPAGTFEALVVEKTGGSSTKRYWFVRGVGKVKEEGGAQLEELLSYEVME